MNNEKSKYRVLIRENKNNQFFDVLLNFRPEENKIHGIMPGDVVNTIDVVITEDELLRLKLTFSPNDFYIQEYVI